MDYANTYDNTYVRLYAGDMQLMINSDAAYSVLPKVSSIISEYFRLTNTPTIKYRCKENGAILTECHILRDFVTLGGEAETKGVFQNENISLPIHYILIAMNHLQLPALIAIDNTITIYLFHNHMVMNKSKSRDMNLHWLRDKEAQKHFELLS